VGPRLPPGPPSEEPVGRLLDDVLHGLAAQRRDSPPAPRLTRMRVAGIALLVASAVCIAVVGVLPEHLRGLAAFVVVTATTAMLLLGGWLIDKASREDQRSEVAPAGISPMHDLLADAAGVPTAAPARKKRFTGFAFLGLSGVCVAVAAMPWHGKHAVDAAMWAGFAITTLGAGVWMIIRASREDKGLSMALAASARRIEARKRVPLGRIK